jgi:hypothetical protein
MCLLRSLEGLPTLLIVEAPVLERVGSRYLLIVVGVEPRSLAIDFSESIGLCDLEALLIPYLNNDIADTNLCLSAP